MSIRDWSVTPASNGNAAPGINWQENVMFVKDTNDSARAMMADIAKWIADTQGTLNATGSANNYSVTTNAGYSALVNGLTLKIKFSIANVGPSLLTVDSLAAKQIIKYGANGPVALSQGDIVADATYLLVYDAVAIAWVLGWFRAVKAGDISDGAITEQKIADNAITPPKLSAGGPTWDSAGNVTIKGTTTSIYYGFPGVSQFGMQILENNKRLNFEFGQSNYMFLQNDATNPTFQLFMGAYGRTFAVDKDGIIGNGSRITNLTIPDNSIGTTKIPDSAVTETKIAPNAVTETKIADSAVTETKIAPNAVTGPKIAPNAVTGPKIADGAITSTKIPPRAIPPDRLSTGAPLWDAAGNLAIGGEARATYFTFQNLLQTGMRAAGTQLFLEFGPNHYIVSNRNEAQPSNSNIEFYLAGLSKFFVNSIGPGGNGSQFTDINGANIKNGGAITGVNGANIVNGAAITNISGPNITNIGAPIAAMPFQGVGSTATRMVLARHNENTNYAASSIGLSAGTWRCESSNLVGVPETVTSEVGVSCFRRIS